MASDSEIVTFEKHNLKDGSDDINLQDDKPKKIIDPKIKHYPDFWVMKNGLHRAL